LSDKLFTDGASRKEAEADAEREYPTTRPRIDDIEKKALNRKQSLQGQRHAELRKIGWHRQLNATKSKQN